jgi:HEPN domain-containing protein
MAKRENKEKRINPELIVKAWLDKYEEDLKSAKALLDSHRYSWCALACQQAIEKFLKAGYVDKYRKVPPYVHKLERLCDELKLTVPERLSRSMVDIDKHYILARYPSYKESVDIKSFKEAKNIYDQTIKILKWLNEELKLKSK